MDNIIDITRLPESMADPHSILGLENGFHLTRSHNYIPELKGKIKLLQDEVNTLKENQVTPEMDKLNELEARLATIEGDVEWLKLWVTGDEERITIIEDKLARNNIY